MYDLIPMEIAASGMKTQRVRMGVLASNLANANSTRAADGPGPYLRQVPVVRAQTLPAFEDMLVEAKAREQAEELAEVERRGDSRSRLLAEEHLRGAQVSEVRTDPAVRRVYDPSHPDADKETGYVEYPDIQVIQEMTDMIQASRGYEANLAVMKSTRDMVMQLLELLRQ